MRHAIVVGGGIGGLGAAVALGRADWRVTVLERGGYREVGAGITLMANAQRALRELGLAEVVHADARPQGDGGVRDSSGRWLSRVAGPDLVAAMGTGIIGIHREVLHRLLRDAVPPEALVGDARVVSVRPAGADRAAVTFVRGGKEHRRTADLVVAADGVRSVVRGTLWPEHPGPRYSGITAWRSVTREPEAVAVTAMSSWGPGTEFGIVPLADGRVYWFAAVDAPEGERSADELGDLRARFGDWHDPVPALLAAARPEDILRHDLYELGRPLGTYVRGPVALLGDAAHAMTPHLGQGAAQALEDAVVLGRACAADRPLRDSLAAYDHARRPRSQAVARASRWAGRLGQQVRYAPLVAARNTVMRRLPPRVALGSMSRFARWDPDSVTC
jgi:2-polyprenyl-6-methoxyphenol hydroxylase-like FAD-dependent oxidoreductase